MQMLPHKWKPEICFRNSFNISIFSARTRKLQDYSSKQYLIEEGATYEHLWKPHICDVHKPSSPSLQRWVVFLCYLEIIAISCNFVKELILNSIWEFE
ncbi:Hypothetical predicted protein [Octopus vulgaris]|uniref:Uncharacterized protein n=1 Tax=Octopus vulgaris TaxID=6645 RepID=A0AA36AVH9_OCTVU|nr:Hypothetical predicted protein [Octopus vulgaris]